MLRKNFQAIRQILRAMPDTIHDIRLVASWDIVRQARRPSFFLIRTLIALLVSIEFIWTWYTSFEARSRIGVVSSFYSTNQIVFMIRAIFLGSMSIMMVAVIVLCPILTVGTVSGDRERKIWYDLVNSPLSGWSILMGKMLSRLGTLVGWVLAVLPVWAILGLVGGLDPSSVLLGMVSILLYGWFYASIGLFASVLSRRTRDALGLATGIVLLVLFSPMLAASTFYILAGANVFNPFTSQIFSALYLLNPFSVISLLNNPAAITGVGSGGYWYLLLIFLMGPILTFISGLLLRPVGQRLESRESRRKDARTPQSMLSDFPLETTDTFRKSDGDGFLSRTIFSAMAIKERKVRGSSQLTRALKMLILGIGLLFGFYFLLTLGFAAFNELMKYGFTSTQRNKRNELSVVIMIISGVLNVVLLYSLTMDAAGRLTTEKETDSWLTLLSTPLEPREILTAKALGSLWSWRIPLGFLFTCWLTGLLTDSIHPIAFGCSIIVWSIQIAFALTCGLYFGCKYQSFQAVSFRSVMLWLALQLIFPLVFGILVRDESIFGIMPAFVAGGSLTIDKFNQTNDRAAGLFLMSLIQIMIMLFISISLQQLCRSTFDRWNNRTLPAPDRLD